MAGTFEDNKGRFYEIQIPSPFSYSNKRRAMRDKNLTYRFCLITNGNSGKLTTVIGVFRSRVITNNDPPIIQKVVNPQPIFFYTWDRFLFEGGTVKKLKKGKENEEIWFEDYFIETDQSFDDIFNNPQEKDYPIYIDHEAYIIKRV